LEQIGLQGRRVQMINLSSAMGGQFAFSIAELTAEIKQLGPNPLGIKDLAGSSTPEGETR
jgi:coenzyme F420-reducing hydrogenase delta subunit